MRFVELMDRKSIGLGFAAFLVVYAVAILIAGAQPSDTEMGLAFVAAIAVSYAVSFVVMRREFSKDK